MADEKYTNILGTPFKGYVKDQIKTRAYESSTLKRSNSEILHLANKNCWIRLVSSVDINDNIITATSGPYYAKNWILFGGTSYLTQNENKYVNNLRYGVDDTPNIPDYISPNAYGMGGTTQLGYRPMPGITSATIEHAGRAGSLRMADIKIKVWNKNQLDAIEKLYFRLGYSCLLEWGHTTYLDNNSKLITQGDLLSPIDVFGDFNNLNSKEKIAKKINQKREDTCGNYDGLFGLVYNYEWSYSSDGGYDCFIKVVGLGNIVDSLKINQSYSMPGGGSISPTQNTNNNSTSTKVSLPNAPLRSDNGTQEDNRIEGNKIIFPNFFKDAIAGAEPIVLDYAALQKNNQATFEIILQNADGSVKKGLLAKDSKNITETKNVRKEIGNTGVTQEVTETYNFKVFDGSPGIISSYSQVESYINPTGNTAIIDPEVQTQYIIPTAALFNFEITNGALKLYKKVKLQEPVVVYTYKGSVIYPEYEDEDIPGKKRVVLDTVVINVYLAGNVGPKFLYHQMAVTSENISKNYGLDKTLPNILLAFINNCFNQMGKTQLSKTIAGRTLNVNTLKEKRANKVKSNSVNITALVRTQFVDKTQAYPTNLISDVTSEYVNSLYEIIKAEAAKSEYKGAITISRNYTENAFLPNKFKAQKTNDITFDIVKAVFTYDELKLINSSNETPDIPNDALNDTQDTLPLVVTSNLDKFLVQLKDSIQPSEKGILDKKTEIEELLGNGVLDSLRRNNTNTPIPATLSELPKEENKQLYIHLVKGFNSEMMSGETKNLTRIPNVNFNNPSEDNYLFNVFAPEINNNSEVPQKYVYIKLGLLFYYINNSCLLYENKKSQKQKTPFIYIDFNPDTNFCLTTKYHLSVDPDVCLIPLNISPNAYKALFPNEIYDGIISRTPFAQSSSDDYVSNQVRTGFTTKQDINESRGRLMNIGVNIDFVLKTLKSQSTSDADNNVYLRSFLETLMEEINKSLGNINQFRVGYYDDGNTVRIYEDQLINAPDGQDTISKENQDKNTLFPSGIPVVGKNSIVRSLELKTDTSTRIGSQIAISAQAGNFGELNQDASGLGSLNNDSNINLVDRIMQQKNTAVNPKRTDSTEITTADKAAADLFNSHVYNIYNQRIFSTSDVETAKNYYSSAANKLKAETKSTKSRISLPISINIGMDGITGLSILEGFTIPTDVLPNQYIDSNGRSKVGFTVAGLSHNIQNNQWTTNIRGIMQPLPVSSHILSDEFGEATISSNVGASNNNINPVSNTSVKSTRKLTTTRNLDRGWEGKQVPYQQTIVDPKVEGPKLSQKYGKVLAQAVLATMQIEQNFRGFNWNLGGFDITDGGWRFDPNLHVGYVVLPEGNNTGKTKAFIAFKNFESFVSQKIASFKRKGFEGATTPQEFGTLWYTKWNGYGARIFRPANISLAAWDVLQVRNAGKIWSSNAKYL